MRSEAEHGIVIEIITLSEAYLNYTQVPSCRGCPQKSGHTARCAKRQGASSEYFNLFGGGIECSQAEHFTIFGGHRVLLVCRSQVKGLSFDDCIGRPGVIKALDSKAEMNSTPCSRNRSGSPTV